MRNIITAFAICLAALAATPAAAQSATAPVTPVAGALVSSVVGKASGGLLISVEATSGATALYIYVFNAVAAPADGAVVAGTASGNYQVCYPVAATSFVKNSYEAVPEIYSVGIVAVASTTACGTLTKSATPVFLKVRAR